MPDGQSPAPPPVVVAVVVTYRPDVAATATLLESLAPQVSSVVVVDNGSDQDTVTALTRLVADLGGEVVPLGTNRGIATAQNIGIERARAQRATHVLLSDQDSQPASDMIIRLLAGMTRARAAAGAGELPVPAAVGPVTMDDRNAGAALVFSDHRWGPRRAALPRQDGALVQASFLIASGCLLDVEALDTVGPMNDAWFIDHIDLEWGLRARRAGFGLYAVVGARLRHALGDRTQRIPGRQRDVHIHSPQRNYYMARNTVLLIRSALMSWWWRAGYAAWITKYSTFYLLAVPPRRRRAHHLVKGLWDGLRGRTGPMDGTGEDEGRPASAPG